MSVITLITCRDQVCTSICSSFKIGHTMREIWFNLPWIKSTSHSFSRRHFTGKPVCSPKLLHLSLNNFVADCNRPNDISQKTNHIKSSWIELNCNSCINYFHCFRADTDSSLFLRQQVVPFSKIFMSSRDLSTFHKTEKNTCITININHDTRYKRKPFIYNGTIEKRGPTMAHKITLYYSPSNVI